MTDPQTPEHTADTAVTTTPSSEIALGEVRKLSIGAGWSWIAQGFTLFKQSPGMWIGILLAFIVISVVVSLVPVVGSLAISVLSPVLMGGLMLGCRDLERGEDLQFSHLFAGFSTQTGPLVMVGVLYLVFALLAVIPGGAIMAVGVMAESGAGDPSGASLIFVIIGVLLMLALIIPVLMAYWFAPTLVVMHGLTAFAAMKLSFKGCLKNILPFLWYGIVVTLLYILALIPIGLGLLVLVPTLIASMYTGYRTIFTD